MSHSLLTQSDVLFSIKTRNSVYLLSLPMSGPVQMGGGIIGEEGKGQVVDVLPEYVPLGFVEAANLLREGDYRGAVARVRRAYVGQTISVPGVIQWTSTVADIGIVWTPAKAVAAVVDTDAPAKGVQEQEDHETVVTYEAHVSDVDMGNHFRTYRRPLLHLDTVCDTFPVYAYTRNIKAATHTLPGERCAHRWIEWTRFGDAHCEFCATVAWSPYFMADDVFGDRTVRNLVASWDHFVEQAEVWESLARDLTNDWHEARALEEEREAMLDGLPQSD